MLTIGGQDRVFRFDFQALRLAERHMTASVMEVLGLHSGLFTLDQLTALCYGAWARGERGLTVEKTEARLDAWMTDEGGTVQELHRAVVEGLVESGLLRPKLAPADEGDRAASRPTPAADPGGSAS